MVVEGDGADTIARKMNSPLNDNMTAEEASFSKKLRKLGDFEKIELSAVPRLVDTFERAVSSDPYYLSPAYYALTGRRGLWSWTPDDDTAVLFCLHPNLKNTVVIFPPFVHPPTNAQNAMQKFLEIMRSTDSGLEFQIGRVPENEPVKDAMLAMRDFKPRAVKEDVLDWAYPVPTYDLAEMRARQGKKYAALRQALNSIDRKFQIHTPDSRLNMREIDFHSKADMYDLNTLVDAWEGNARAKQTHPHVDRYTVEDNDYFDHLFRMAKVQELNLRGMFLVLDGKPQGFAIWEAPVGDSETANVFASQVAIFNNANDETTTPHWSTGMIYKMGREIANTGGRKICLGGSETPQQFNFKEKFGAETLGHLTTVVIDIGTPQRKDVPNVIEQPTHPITVATSRRDRQQGDERDYPSSGGQQQMAFLPFNDPRIDPAP
jgi:hypothetical protein